jgi:hypothetical protein
MSNKVENELLITGEKEDLERFKEFAKGFDEDLDTAIVLDMKNFVPYTKNLSKNGDGSEIFDWCNENWGTAGYFREPRLLNRYLRAWKDLLLVCFIACNGSKEKLSDLRKMIQEMNLSLPEDELYYEFNTVWSPPIPVIKKMGEMFPYLNFELRYFEGRMNFNGILIIEGGKIILQEEGAYFGHRGG